MKRFLMIVALSIVTTQLHGMTTEPAADASDVKTVQTVDSGSADAKEAKEVDLYKLKAREFVDKLPSKDADVYRWIQRGMLAVKAACEDTKSKAVSIQYAFMTQKSIDGWTGQDTYFIRNHGIQFSELVEAIACAKLNKTKTELTRFLLGVDKGALYVAKIEPHMLALAKAILALVEPHVSKTS